jgi:hypothetical protein
MLARAKMPITKLPLNGYGYSCNRNRFLFAKVKDADYFRD